MSLNQHRISLRQVNDQQLLTNIKQLTHTEREVLTRILRYLREIERRRLFSELGYASLFEFAVKELKYSEGQAGRRIQAMRLIHEIPEVEHQIASGNLSLTNVSQAQSFFRELAKSGTAATPVAKEQKIKILKLLENKSARDGERELIKLQPQAALPKERERMISEDQSEIRFVMTTQLKNKLEQVRSLLGPKGATMNFSELLNVMTDMSVQSLEAKKFGKRRSSSPLVAPPRS